MNSTKVASFFVVVIAVVSSVNPAYSQISANVVAFTKRVPGVGDTADIEQWCNMDAFGGIAFVQRLVPPLNQASGTGVYFADNGGSGFPVLVPGNTFSIGFCADPPSDTPEIVVNATIGILSSQGIVVSEDPPLFRGRLTGGLGVTYNSGEGTFDGSALFMQFSASSFSSVLCSQNGQRRIVANGGYVIGQDNAACDVGSRTYALPPDDQNYPEQNPVLYIPCGFDFDSIPYYIISEPVMNDGNLLACVRRCLNGSFCPGTNANSIFRFDLFDRDNNEVIVVEGDPVIGLNVDATYTGDFSHLSINNLGDVAFRATVRVVGSSEIKHIIASTNGLNSAPLVRFVVGETELSGVEGLVATTILDSVTTLPFNDNGEIALPIRFISDLTETRNGIVFLYDSASTSNKLVVQDDDNIQPSCPYESLHAISGQVAINQSGNLAFLTSSSGNGATVMVAFKPEDVNSTWPISRGIGAGDLIANSLASEVFVVSGIETLDYGVKVSPTAGKGRWFSDNNKFVAYVESQPQMGIQTHRALVRVSVSAPESCKCKPLCPADFNNDGGVTGADVEAFFAAFESGFCSADVNNDGGVDGQDTEEFFTLWGIGGC